MLTILARTFLVFLLVAACSLLLAGATEELENPEATTFNHGLSGRLANSAFLIARLEEKLNETWSRVRQLQTIEDPNEPVQIGENGTLFHLQIFPLCFIFTLSARLFLRSVLNIIRSLLTTHRRQLQQHFCKVESFLHSHMSTINIAVHLQTSA
jgi:hypothetical protein